MKNVYFLSDAHLGSWAIDHGRTQERRLVRFLDSIKTKARAIYLLGDMFDFWCEWRYVVPKGYTRFLGKLSELTDMGVEVHYFTGNHDIWTYGYLEEECGLIVHTKPETVEIYDKVFYIAHGDGLGDPDTRFKFLRRIFHSRTCQTLFSSLHPRWALWFGMSWAKHSRFKFIKSVFHNRTCQVLFNSLHPRWAMWFGLTWAKHSRLKRADGKEPPYMGEDREHLVLFAKQYMKTHNDVDYFMFGHRHIELDLFLSKKTRMMILGDWITQFTYAVFDGEHMFLEEYVEGESQP